MTYSIYGRQSDLSNSWDLSHVCNVGPVGNLRREAFVALPHNTEPLDLVWVRPQWIYPGQCEEGTGKECRAEPSFEWSWKIRPRLKLVPRLQGLNNFVLLDPDGIQTGANERPKKNLFFLCSWKTRSVSMWLEAKTNQMRLFVLGPRTTAHQQTTDGVVLLCLHVDRSVSSAWSTYVGGERAKRLCHEIQQDSRLSLRRVFSSGLWNLDIPAQHAQHTLATKRRDPVRSFSSKLSSESRLYINDEDRLRGSLWSS